MSVALNELIELKDRMNKFVLFNEKVFPVEYKIRRSHIYEKEINFVIKTCLGDSYLMDISIKVTIDSPCVERKGSTVFTYRNKDGKLRHKFFSSFGDFEEWYLLTGRDVTLFLTWNSADEWIQMNEFKSKSK